MNQLHLQHIKSYYENRYVPSDMGSSRRSPYTYQILLDWLNVQPNTKLLDVGCGTGGLLKCASSKIQGFGVDLAERAISIANQTTKTSQFNVGDMQRLSFVNGCFDYIVNSGSLEHVPDMTKALNEMLRVCTDDGKICLVVPNTNFFWYKITGTKGTKQQEMVEHLLSFEEWKYLIESIGLEIIAVKRDPGPNIRTDYGLKVFIRGVLRSFVLYINKLMSLHLTYQFVFICKRQIQ